MKNEEFGDEQGFLNEFVRLKSERESMLVALDKAIKERDRVSSLIESERNIHLNEKLRLQEHIESLKAEVNSLRESTSWKLTRPIRAVKLRWFSS